jgi:glycosyltransferase involved in cell wall biosynthesis
MPRRPGGKSLQQRDPLEEISGFVFRNQNEEKRIEVKVCLICNQIAAWGKIGGFGTNTRRLGRGLVQAGVEVHVVVPRRAGQGRLEQLDGMMVHGQSNTEVFFGKNLYCEIDADIYHMEEPTICGYWAQRAMPRRIHLVTSMDPREPSDWWVELKNATWLRRLKYPIQHYYENSQRVHEAVRRANGVYVEAAFLKPKTQRLYKLHYEPGLLPKPIEIPDGPFQKASRALCVFLGRFDPRKRPEMFFQLAERMPDVSFVAVGKAHDQSYQRYLNKRYFNLDNLEVTGFVDPFTDDKLDRILRRAWVLVHPAAREGLPTAFQEASAHEAAILAYVDPGGYVSRFGRVVPEEGGGIEAMEHQLREMIESDEWREKGQAGREYNVKHHSVDVSVKTHLNVYRMHFGE